MSASAWALRLSTHLSPLGNTDVSLLLQDGWLLDRPTVERYLTRVESLYNSNPYHNNIHAADVTQTAAVMMTALDMHLRSGCQKCSSCPTAAHATNILGVDSCTVQILQQSANSNSDSSCKCSSSHGLSKLECFAIIFASAVHDLGHPGVNNAFLVKTRDKQAVKYNDKSVNENMHASMAFSLIDEDEYNLFKNFSASQYEQVSLRSNILCTSLHCAHCWCCFIMLVFPEPLGSAFGTQLCC